MRKRNKHTTRNIPDIIGEAPPFLIRSGLFYFLLLVLAALVCLNFIPYHETIKMTSYMNFKSVAAGDIANMPDDDHSFSIIVCSKVKAGDAITLPAADTNQAAGFTSPYDGLLLTGISLPTEKKEQRIIAYSSFFFQAEIDSFRAAHLKKIKAVQLEPEENGSQKIALAIDSIRKLDENNGYAIYPDARSLPEPALVSLLKRKNRPVILYCEDDSKSLFRVIIKGRPVLP